MCNRNRCGCGCNRRWNEEEFFTQDFDDRFNRGSMREAECMLREHDRRRRHEECCAREFVRCMRCRNWND